jgi:hypothetical protein
MVKAAGFSYNDLIDLDDERDKNSGLAYTIQSQAYTVPGYKVFKNPGWPIISGDKFTVQRPTGDATLFVDVIKLRCSDTDQRCQGRIPNFQFSGNSSEWRDERRLHRWRRSSSSGATYQLGMPYA